MTALAGSIIGEFLARSNDRSGRTESDVIVGIVLIFVLFAFEQLAHIKYVELDYLASKGAAAAEYVVKAVLIVTFIVVQTVWMCRGKQVVYMPIIYTVFAVAAETRLAFYTFKRIK